MKKIGKAMALVLAICFLLSIFAGCGNQQQAKESTGAQTTTAAATETQPVKEEPLVINFLDMACPKSNPEADNVIYKWLKENKNIDIQWEGVPEKQDERMNLILASGEMPDVVQVLTSSTNTPIANKWADAGLLEPLDDWMGKYPGLISQVDKNYMKYAFTNPKDGKNYMLPTNAAATKITMKPDIGPFIREDWLKAIGKEAPRTTDDLFEVLKLFKEKIPDVDGKKIIPMTTDIMQLFAYSWTKNWYDLAPDGSSLSFMWIDSRMEEMLVYFNKLYKAGLLDPECFTQKFEQYSEKLASGRVGYTGRIHTDMDTANKALKAKDPAMRFIPAPMPMVKEYGFVPLWQQYQPTCFNAVTVSKKFASDKRKMERLMEYLDWSASLEGQNLLSMGPEGEYYDKGSDGLYKMKETFSQEKATANNTFLEKTGIEYYRMLILYPDPPNIVNERTEESSTLAAVWKEAWGEFDLPMLLTLPGPIEQQKWGDMWAQFNGFMAKAIYAKNEDECRKAAKEMLKAYETNGGRDIVNERLKSIQDFLKQ